MTSVAPLPAGLSVVVPAYNSAGTLPQLVERLIPVLKSLGLAHELILIDDGSADNSWTVIEKLGASHGWVRGIRMMRNYGQHNAVLAGIRAARYDKIMTMDDDLQHPPEQIPKLMAALTEELDVVYAPPELEQHGVFRDIASVITKLAMTSALGAETARKVSAWRVFRTQVRDAFADFHSPFVSIDVLLTWGTKRFASLLLPHEPRTIGKSNYTFRHLARHAMTMVTGFSVLPLQVASVVGFTFTLFGIGVLAYVIGRYLLLGYSVAGFPFLASIIAIFSGAQLFALGMLGEYLARMHFRIMDKPTYVVRVTLNENR